MNDVLKTVFEYIKENHPDTAIFMVDAGCFAVSSAEKRVSGNRRSVYSGGGWDVAIGHPVTPEIIYNVKAVYNNGEIIWTGSILNGKVEEQSYENITP